MPQQSHPGLPAIHIARRSSGEPSAQQLYTLAQLQAASKQQLQRLSAVGESLAADLADLQQVRRCLLWTSARVLVQMPPLWTFVVATSA